MLTVTHNNATLESFHLSRIGHDISNVAIASARRIVDQCDQLSVSSGQLDDGCHSSDEIELTDSCGPSTLDTVLASEIKAGDGEEPFFVGDLGIVVKQFNKWKELFPRVEPFYAVKCNTDKSLLNVLENLGTGFDCASKAEMSIMLEMGVDSSRIIYANPCKPASHIRFAREKGVRLMTFDNMTELVKIKKEYPEAHLVLRIVTDDTNSVCRFSEKFGAALSSVEILLQEAKSMDLNIVGVSFHVGSGCYDASQYWDAIKSAKFVFEKAAELGFAFNLLDIGGGFPGDDDAKVTVEEIAHVVNEAIDTFFPQSDYPFLDVIAEPGRYFAAAAFALAVCVTSCRIVMEKSKDDGLVSKKYMYYVNDGVYGSFNCVLFDHAVVCPQVFTQYGRFVSSETHDSSEVFTSSIWGPTCDSMDCIMKEKKLPELHVGDWFVFKNMGAYTMAAATTFNGFPLSKVTYINENAWRDRYKTC